MINATQGNSYNAQTNKQTQPKIARKCDHVKSQKSLLQMCTYILGRKSSMLQHNSTSRTKIDQGQTKNSSQFVFLLTAPLDCTDIALMLPRHTTKSPNWAKLWLQQDAIHLRT